MSYDLWFWKQAGQCQKAPQEIADELASGNDVVGLEKIEIRQLTSRIIEEFPEIESHFNTETKELRQLILDPDGEDWVILCGWDDLHLCVESHSAPGDVLNQFIDVAYEFGCPLYDPQTGERYVSE